MILQERIEEIGSGILEIKEDKAYLNGFMSSERLHDYVENGSQCFSSNGIYDVCDIDYSKIMDDSLIITIKEGIEISRYQFEPIFIINGEDNFKYSYIEDGKKKQTTKAFTIRKCKYSNLYNFKDVDISILFNSFDELNSYFLETYNKKLEDVFLIMHRHNDEEDIYFYKDFYTKRFFNNLIDLKEYFLNRFGRRLSISDIEREDKKSNKKSNKKTINRILAIDFETANRKRSSICSIGIALLEDGEIILNSEYLINPEEDFDFQNVNIHKITAEMVKDKPIFPEVWKYIEGLIDNNTLVIAHNSDFDMDVLYKTGKKYDIEFTTFSILCTLFSSRNYWLDFEEYSLSALANTLGKQFEHHKASDDALMCLEIFRELTKDIEVITKDILEDRFKISLGKITKKNYVRCINNSSSGIIKKSNKSENKFNQIKFDKKEIYTNNTTFDTEHPVYGKLFAFTGEYINFTDKDDAKQRVVDLGGHLNKGSVTKQTNYLVVGTTNLIATRGKEKSSKVVKAENYQSKGQDIQIISEEEFITLLSGNVEKEIINKIEDEIEIATKEIINKIEDEIEVAVIDKNLIPPKDDWIKFENKETKIMKLKEYKLLSPKADKIDKVFYYKGTYTDVNVKCDILGYIDSDVLIISIEDNLHCIRGEYLKQMQDKNFSRLILIEE